ncbi:glycosyltransferase, partial [bacterium]
MRCCAVLCVHDDNHFLEAALRAVESLPRLVLVSRIDWTGRTGAWEKSVEIAEACGAEVEVGDWTEVDHRERWLAAPLERGFTHALLIDSDEVVEPELLANLLKIAEGGLAEQVHVELDTYWKDAAHVVRPREPFNPSVLVDLRAVRFGHVREFIGGRRLFLNGSFGIVHHLSYAGDDARIWKKTTTWSHRDELVPDWWQRSWKGWDAEPMLRDLHPTHPPSYRFVERIPVPDILRSAGLETEARAFEEPRVKPCSVVIPAHGGQEDLDACLASLARCEGLVEEIVVVDDGSPLPLAVPESVTLVRTEENLGFARACNAGFERTKGATVVFLNSDTVVPRAGLARLLEALHRSGSVAAAGPYSNNAGHGQGLDPTYTDVSRLDLFAEDFARRAAEDREVDMLVGFCLAAKRHVLEEVGLF